MNFQLRDEFQHFGIAAFFDRNISELAELSVPELLIEQRMIFSSLFVS